VDCAFNLFVLKYMYIKLILRLYLLIRDATIDIQITPWSTVLLQKLTVTQLVKKCPAFYGT